MRYSGRQTIGTRSSPQNLMKIGAIPCFLRETTILTAQGAKKIEDLAVGDCRPTVFGGMRRRAQYALAIPSAFLLRQPRPPEGSVSVPPQRQYRPVLGQQDA